VSEKDDRTLALHRGIRIDGPLIIQCTEIEDSCYIFARGYAEYFVYSMNRQCFIAPRTMFALACVVYALYIHLDLVYQHNQPLLQIPISQTTQFSSNVKSRRNFPPIGEIYGSNRGGSEVRPSRMEAATTAMTSATRKRRCEIGG
jgi:hypothetical protein